jgi:hypothetical protein
MNVGALPWKTSSPLITEGAGLPHTTNVLPHGEARRRIEHDRRILLDEIACHPADELSQPYRIAGGPLGDSCESLHDLVAHVLMWDEISLAVLHEAVAGRPHWSLESRWEEPGVGRRLNEAGVAAGRRLPIDLLLHRFNSVRDALSAELGGFSDDQWNGPLGLDIAAVTSLGGLAQYAMTVPRMTPYWHAALHLQAANLDETVRTGSSGATTGRTS